MEAAASVIAVIAFSLQSTKFVYQAVDDIRDGPSVIAALAESTKRLEGILKQLEKLITHASQSQQPSTLATWQALEQKISECSKDMQDASQQVQVLSPNHANQKLGKAWSRVKLSLKEKFFARPDDRIKGHLAELAVQLQILSSESDISRDVRQIQHNTSSEASMRDVNNTISLMSTTLEDRTIENSQQIKTSLASIMTSLANGADVANAKRVEESRSLLQSLQQNAEAVENRVHQSEQNILQHIQLGSEPIVARLDRTDAMSETQTHTIVELLRQIHGCLKIDATVASPTINQSDAKLQNPLHDMTSNCEERGLSAAIERLCRFASNTTTVYDAGEAEEIFDDLEHIINSLLNYNARNAEPCQSNRKRKRSADDRDLDVQHEMKKVRGLLTASRAVQVTGSGPARQNVNHQGRRLRTKHSMEVYEMADCTAMVSVRTGMYGSNILMPGVEAIPVRNEHGLFQAHISLLPRQNTRVTKISAFFTQQITDSGFSSPFPGVVFHPIIPDNAEIFKAVMKGDVDWMLELFDAGKASLHDCDSEGRSLLNYAIYDLQVSSCRFLVDHGADVDSLEKRVQGGVGEWYLAPLDQYRCNESQMNQEKLSKILAVRQCLLESGADPLIGDPIIGGYFDSFSDILVTSPSAVAESTLKYGKVFIDLNSRDEHGEDYFLQMLHGFIHYPPSMRESEAMIVGVNLSQSIRVLLAHGADLRSRNSLGENCLRVLIDTFARHYDFDPNEDPRRKYVLDRIERAHDLRVGQYWESALEKAGWDVEQVYLEDHQHGTGYAAKCFLPSDGSHPRLKSKCSCHERLDRRLEGINRSTDPGSIQSETDPEESDAVSSNSQKVSEPMEYNPNISNLAVTRGGTTEHASYSDSDDEMGGVRITTVAQLLQ
ncbi:MAG: hypothetical protein Q9168_007345 [Polycauliona sp. 1 TL-2023]